MLRLLTKSWWLLCLAFGLQSACAFSLLGPREPYQVGQLGYGTDFSQQPHNLGEEFRWNIPTLYYAFDESFLDYFGSNGVHAVDSAMNMLNGLFSTNVSSWSRELSEFPLRASQVNYTASAMHLYDLKSAVLELMMERLNLADPERFTWTLRQRVPISPPGCPFFFYAVIKRNFDPVTWEPTSYVNGNLFTYFILETCPNPDAADAVEVLVDPDGYYLSALASFKIGFPAFYGYFHTGVTRDDAGGLRYMYRSNNVNLEAAGPNTFTYVTNNVAELVVSSNLTLLAAQSITNSAAALQALYPNLVITSSTNFWTNVFVDTVTAYFTNSPYQPAYFPPTLVFVTNRTLTVQTLYHHLFGNVATLEYVNGQWVAQPLVDIFQHTSRVDNILLTVNVTNATSPTVPAYLLPLQTNVTARYFLTNAVVGEYIILPTNACDLAILGSQLAFTNIYTNVIVQATNIVNTNLITNTNFISATNLANMSFSQSLLDASITHAFLVNQVFCPTSNLALRQGIEHLQFVRRDFDSLLGRYWYPVTNIYKVIAITNNTAYEQTIQRIVTQPDFLFAAADWTFPATGPFGNPLGAREVPRWNSSGTVTNVFGPGTIEPFPPVAPGTLPPPTFTFNKVGPLYINQGPFFIDEATAILDYIWASYDGTTNAPVVYPSGTSLVNMENQILMPVTATDLITGTPLGMTNVLTASVGAETRFQFSAAGGQPPYTWAIAPGSPNLPPGFDPPGFDGLFADGIIAGTPTSAGKYAFILRMSDSAGRFVDRPYFIYIQ